MTRNNSLKGLQFPRKSWLKRNGFGNDPFQENAAIICERDELFKREHLTAFVAPPQLSRFIDIEKTSVIFVPWGGGKTAIQYHFLHDYAARPAQNVLSMEHEINANKTFQGNIPGNSAQLSESIHEQIHLAALTEANHPTALNRLCTILNNASEEGVRHIAALVDLTIRPKSESLRNIQTKLSRTTALLKFATQRELATLAKTSIAFKFLLPVELQEMVQVPFDVQLINLTWNKNTFEQMLEARLKSSSEGKIKTLSGLCDLSCNNTIDYSIINVGIKWKTPRAMWQLGNFILEEHFKEPYTKRTPSDHINAKTVQHAETKATEWLQGIENWWSQIKMQLGNTPPRDNEKESQLQQLREILNSGKAEEAIKRELDQFLRKFVNQSELQCLCFQFDIKYDNLPSKTIDGKIQDFVSYLARRSQLPNLENAWKICRPTDL